MSYTKIGSKYVVHGIFGEIASEQYEENAHNLVKYDLERIKYNGEEMLRIFDTPKEAEAYLQGVQDMCGNEGFSVTSAENHDKIYGDIKNSIKKLK